MKWQKPYAIISSMRGIYMNKTVLYLEWKKLILFLKNYSVISQFPWYLYLITKTANGFAKNLLSFLRP